MSLQLCPNCKKVASTWLVDDEERTWWYCGNCEFKIEEDERKETECDSCQVPLPTMSYLKGLDGHYYWCGTCGFKKLV